MKESFILYECNELLHVLLFSPISFSSLSAPTLFSILFLSECMIMNDKNGSFFYYIPVLLT